VLLHCFAGCSVTEIVGAIGLELHELFPPRNTPPGAPKRTPKLLTAGQALDLLADESMLIAITAANIVNGVSITTADKDRALKAAGHINFLRRACMGGEQ